MKRGGILDRKDVLRPKVTNLEFAYPESPERPSGGKGNGSPSSKLLFRAGHGAAPSPLNSPRSVRRLTVIGPPEPNSMSPLGNILQHLHHVL